MDNRSSETWDTVRRDYSKLREIEQSSECGGMSSVGRDQSESPASTNESYCFSHYRCGLGSTMHLDGVDVTSSAAIAAKSFAEIDETEFSQNLFDNIT
jgi:hypothetical protein